MTNRLAKRAHSPVIAAISAMGSSPPPANTLTKRPTKKGSAPVQISQLALTRRRSYVGHQLTTPAPANRLTKMPTNRLTKRLAKRGSLAHHRSNVGHGLAPAPSQ